MPNSFFNRFGEGILNKLNPLAVKSDHTNLDCGAIHFDIKDGIAKTPRGLAFQTTEVTWTGGGKINFKTEQIDLRATSKARKGLGISMGDLAKLLQLRGPITDPVLVPDPVGLMKLGAEVGFAVMTGGLSLLFETASLSLYVA